MNKSIGIAGKYTDENDTAYAKTLKTDNEGNIKVSKFIEKALTATVSVAPGTTVPLAEYSCSNFSEMDFILTTGTSDLKPLIDYEINVIFRPSDRDYSHTSSGISYPVNTQINDTISGSLKRSITIVDFKRIPLFNDFFMLQFKNKTTATIDIRTQSVRRFS